MKYRATAGYDGTNFFGFQRQANHRSVQGELESAIEKVLGTGEKIMVTGAGRTDTGVHASGQVISFDVHEEWKHGVARLQRAINICLPFDVAVNDVAECDGRFHARFSAVSRTYDYSVLVLDDVRRPLERLYEWQVYDMPDVQQMNEAAGQLVGEHDFAAFGSAPVGEETVRRVVQARWMPHQLEGKNQDRRLTFTIEANAFLFRMVRRIVATLMRVGHGKLDAKEVNRMMIDKQGNAAFGAAPACGLCLVNVRY